MVVGCLCGRGDDVIVTEVGAPHPTRSNSKLNTTVLAQGYYNSVDGAVLQGSLRCNDPSVSLRDKAQTSIVDSSSSDDDSSSINEEQNTHPPTRIRACADKFDEVNKSQGGETANENELDMARLLKALHGLVELLEKCDAKLLSSDMLVNIRKIEKVYNMASEDKRRTLADLLQFEKSKGMHKKKGAALKDPSAAYSLIWLRRNLSFLYKMYSLVLEQGTNPVDAASSAFRSEWQEHMGWAMKKVAGVGIKATTPKSTRQFLATLGGYHVKDMTPEEEQATINDLKYMLSVWRPLLVKWMQTFLRLDLEEGTHRSSMLRFHRSSFVQLRSYRRASTAS